ncbi:MAG: RNA methyltransferase [Elusimicrobia bacterium]|nr:RNA methyltransferase [Elusimicrobiota bacterium]
MRVERVTDAADPRLADYADTRDPDELKRRGVFIAESREVVRALIKTRRFGVRSLLVVESMLRSLADDLAELDDAAPVYVAERDLMTSVAGYDVHRGCLAAGERGGTRSLADLLVSAAGPGRRVVVALEAVSNPDNVGGIFRNALAFRADGVVLGPGCADPLYRKAIRTSMAASLRVGFAPVLDMAASLAALRAAGFLVVALTAKGPAVDLARFASEPRSRGRLALVVGSEGPGLSDATLRAADVSVRIAMAPDVDSLNVGTASGIALHRLSAPG